MKAIILAAGYATRLYPLTQDFPKPLLEVGGRTIIDRLIDGLEHLDLDSVSVVVNRRFARHFREWGRCELIENTSTHEGDRLGAVADLSLGLSEAGDEHVLVAAADSIFGFDLADLVEHFDSAAQSTICVWHNPDLTDRARRGNVVVNDELHVTRFVEKPATPESEWSAAPLYVLRSEDAAHVNEYLSAGGNPDAPGHFIESLAQTRRLSAYPLDAPPIDIGTHDALAKARLDHS